MELIQTINVTTTGVTAFSFLNVPQDYTDLIMTIAARLTSNPGGSWSNVAIQFNDSTTNYRGNFLYGDGGSVASGIDDSVGYVVARISNAFTTSNTFGSATLHLPNYTANANKVMLIDQVTENNATSALQMITIGRWANTSAITKVVVSSSEFAIGSTISLYGVRKGSGLATVS